MPHLNDMLRLAGLDPRLCTVMLHTPREPVFRRQLAAIFQTRRDVFEAYQASHAAPATATLRGRPKTVVFLGMEDGCCLLAGVYDVPRPVDRDEAWMRAQPGIAALAEYGIDYPFGGPRPFFDLVPTDEMADLVGRLAIAPRLTRAYVRLADTLDAEVVEIARESRFDPPPPPWRQWLPTGPEIRALGPSQAARLREWRGVYLIVDESDGARYVGSACGAANLLGRWQAHVAGEAGVTRGLTARNPVNFRFSILERVSPDMPADEVIALEHTWMERLHTRRFGLNA